MDPPTTQEVFDTMDDAVVFAKSHAERHGYALTRANLIRDKRKQVRRLDLRCDKGGKQRGEGIVRKSSTSMTECPFELHLFRVDPVGGQWQITVFEASHNHRAADGPEQHAQYRRPTDEETKQIGELAKAGVAPRHIVNYLHQQNPGTNIASYDVYNAKAKLKKQRLQEHTYPD
jgi:FAR1 DNA-binding domain